MVVASPHSGANPAPPALELSGSDPSPSPPNESTRAFVSLLPQSGGVPADRGSFAAPVTPNVGEQSLTNRLADDIALLIDMLTKAGGPTSSDPQEFAAAVQAATEVVARQQELGPAIQEAAKKGTLKADLQAANYIAAAKTVIRENPSPSTAARSGRDFLALSLAQLALSNETADYKVRVAELLVDSSFNRGLGPGHLVLAKELLSLMADPRVSAADKAALKRAVAGSAYAKELGAATIKFLETFYDATAAGAKKPRDLEACAPAMMNMYMLEFGGEHDLAAFDSGGSKAAGHADRLNSYGRFRRAKLENEIGAELGLKPNNLPANHPPPPQLAKALAQGHWQLYADDQLDIIRAVIKGIDIVAGPHQKGAKIEALPLIFQSPESYKGNHLGRERPVRSPVMSTVIWRVTSAQGAVGFVDFQGRTYKSVEDFAEHNHLPYGKFLIPAGGRLQIGADGKLAVEQHEKVETAGDVAWEVGRDAILGLALIGATTLLVTGLLASGGLAAPAELAAINAAATAAVWAGAGVSTASAIADLSDRAHHGQEWLPGLETANDYLAIAASLSGAGAAAAPRAFASAADAGLMTLTTAKTAAKGLAATGAAFNAVANLDGTYELYDKWNQMPAKERWFDVLQTLLFAAYAGVSAVNLANGRNPIEGAAQQTADHFLRERIQDRLRDIQARDPAALAFARRMIEAQRRLRELQAKDPLGFARQLLDAQRRAALGRHVVPGAAPTGVHPTPGPSGGTKFVPPQPQPRGMQRFFQWAITRWINRGASTVSSDARPLPPPGKANVEYFAGLEEAKAAQTQAAAIVGPDGRRAEPSDQETPTILGPDGAPVLIGVAELPHGHNSHNHTPGGYQNAVGHGYTLLAHALGPAFADFQAGRRLAVMPIPQGGKAYYAASSEPLTFKDQFMGIELGDRPTFIDEKTLREVAALPEDIKSLVDVFMTGFNPAVPGIGDYIEGMMRKHPNVFVGYGEVTFHKELVSRKLGDEAARLDNRNLDELFNACARTGLMMVVHNDIGEAPVARNNRPMRGPTKNEYFDPLMQLFAAHPDVDIVWAHTGLGRFVAPSRDHIDLLRRVLEDPSLSHVNFDISWSDVASAYTRDPQLGDAFINLMIEHPDRFLYGSDTIKAGSRGQYLVPWRIYEPLFRKLLKRPGGENAFYQITMGNYERLVGRAKERVAAWTARQPGAAGEPPPAPGAAPPEPESHYRDRPSRYSLPDPQSLPVDAHGIAGVAAFGATVSGLTTLYALDHPQALTHYGNQISDSFRSALLGGTTAYRRGMADFLSNLFDKGQFDPVAYQAQVGWFFARAKSLAKQYGLDEAQVDKGIEHTLQFQADLKELMERPLVNGVETQERRLSEIIARSTQYINALDADMGVSNILALNEADPRARIGACLQFASMLSFSTSLAAQIHAIHVSPGGTDLLMHGAFGASWLGLCFNDMLLFASGRFGPRLQAHKSDFLRTLPILCNHTVAFASALAAYQDFMNGHPVTGALAAGTAAGAAVLGTKEITAERRLGTDREGMRQALFLMLATFAMRSMMMIGQDMAADRGASGGAPAGGGAQPGDRDMLAYANKALRIVRFNHASVGLSHGPFADETLVQLTQTPSMTDAAGHVWREVEGYVRDASQREGVKKVTGWVEEQCLAPAVMGKDY